MKMMVDLRMDLFPFIKYSCMLCSATICLTAAYFLGKRHAKKGIRPSRDVSQNEEIESLLGKLILDDDDLRSVMNLMESEMENGLESDENTDLKMIPTYVRHLPNGNERGKILALDLGGTNFRVLEVNLDDRSQNITSKIFVVPERLMTGDGQALFDHLARSISDFMKHRNLRKTSKVIPLGFTFSFPCKQNSLNSADLITWTKGFNCTGVEGTDVVKKLQDAIDKRDDMNVQVMALVNDTVGTLMTCAHKDHDCRVGVIFGTGTNACYVEQMDKVKKWTSEQRYPPQVIINTEWGAFGDNGCLDFLRTAYDIDIDKTSVNPGKQCFEKMISGMYLGELTRIILLDLIEKDLIFPGLLSQSPSRLGYLRQIFSPGGFYSRYVSDIELDEGVAFNETKKKLEDLGFENPSYEDCSIVRNVCERVSMRAAYLSAAGNILLENNLQLIAMAVLINRIGSSRITIGVDGSLYRHHPRFKRNLEIALSRLVDRRITYRLVLSEDGSGKGAALVAAVADRINTNPETKFGDFADLTPNRSIYENEVDEFAKINKISSCPAVLLKSLAS